MKESEQLKVTDLRIGDKVRAKNTDFEFEFVVTGIFWNLETQETDATLLLDFEGNTGNIFAFDLKDVEKVER